MGNTEEPICRDYYNNTKWLKSIKYVLLARKNTEVLA